MNPPFARLIVSGLVAAMLVQAAVVAPSLALANESLPTPAAAPSPAASLHISSVSLDARVDGVDVSDQGARQFGNADEDSAQAFNDALAIAFAHRDSFGYPWLDTTTKVFELRVADVDGAVLAQKMSDGLQAQGFTVRIVTARHSIADMDAVADAITRLAVAGVPNADKIWEIVPDQQDERVVVVMDDLDQGLIAQLADRYGSDILKVQIASTERTTSNLNRNDDVPPFWGGSKIYLNPGGQCTAGFSWYISSSYTQGMLTAAHCVPDGGLEGWPSYPNVGYVSANSRENWQDGVGTTYYTGEHVYRGDVALIQLSSYTDVGRVYDGDAGTSTNTNVKKMASRRSQVGDAVCANGVTTGGWCGAVLWVNVDIYYFNNGGGWARNMVHAAAIGWTCPTGGDSGAPVYRNLSDGSVAAVGIHSGSFASGITCDEYFTDIWDPYSAFPGYVKTQY